MTRYLLDTNICIEAIRGRCPHIVTRVRQYDVYEVGISAITFAELMHGVEKSAHPERNRIALSRFCAPLSTLPFDDEAAVAYGRIRATLEREGRTIGPMDLLIAAHAMASGCILVTNNEREFRRVEGVQVENWL